MTLGSQLKSGKAQQHAELTQRMKFSTQAIDSMHAMMILIVAIKSIKVLCPHPIFGLFSSQGILQSIILLLDLVPQLLSQRLNLLLKLLPQPPGLTL
jgi:hypothetical protein